MLKKENKQKLCFEEFVGQIYCIFPTKNTFISLQQLPTARGRPIKDREVNLLSQPKLYSVKKQSKLYVKEKALTNILFFEL